MVFSPDSWIKIWLKGLNSTILLDNSALGVSNFDFLLYTRSLFCSCFFGGDTIWWVCLYFQLLLSAMKQRFAIFGSEVSCLYISNTKMINLREPSKGDLFYILLASLFAATYPDTRQTHGIFHRLEPMRKRLVCCTSILKANDIVGSKRKSNRDFPWHYDFCFYENCYICNVMKTFWRI